VNQVKKDRINDPTIYLTSIYFPEVVGIMASRGQDGEAAKNLAPMLTRAGFIHPQTDHRPIAGGM
jgi:hypothetical protein